MTEGELQPTPASILSGELSGDQVDELLDRAERDPDTSAELDLAADLLAAAEVHREALEPGLPPRIRLEPAPARSVLRYALLAAAVLACVVPLAWLALRDTAPLSPQPVDVATLADRSLPVYIVAGLRDPDEGLRRSFAEAMRPYSEGRHEASVTALSAFLEGHASHGSARFYLAASLEQLGRLDEALVELEHVAREAGGTDALLAEHALWRAAQIHLVRGRTELARGRLAELVDGGGAYAPNARNLSSRLEQR